METIKQINQEFKPSEILTGSSENELKNLWDITAAEAAAPGTTENIILTPELINQYLEGLQEIPELQQAIEDLTDYYNLDYFHYNNYLLVDSDIKIYLTSYYRQDDFKDNLKLETDPNYNILLEKLPLDAPDYFNTDKYEYNPYYRDEGNDAIDFLTWTILEDNANGDQFKDIITDKDITAAIRQQSQEHQNIIRTANYTELFQDIKTTYNKILKDYIQEAQEALYNKFYDEIYFYNYTEAEQYIITEYQNQPINNIR